MTCPVCPAYAVAQVAPDALESLTEIERFVLPMMYELWTRPEQIFPGWDWRALGFVCGRGWGKTTTIAQYINTEIEAGRIRSLGLMAPKEDRVDEVQIKNLIATAPPWFKPERWGGTIRWPNGVVAEVHTAEVPDGTRSSSFDLLWLTEIVAWNPATRAEAFKNATTACRAGRAQFVWDTTSKGKNEIVLALEEMNRADPTANPIVRGYLFDNPMLSPKYVKATCAMYEGQEFDEEILGLVFQGAAGALWTQDRIDGTWRPERPKPAVLTVVAIDPALSADPSADETGFVVGDRGQDGHSYVHTDESGHYTPDEWASLAVDWCDGTLGTATGIVIERNHLGDNAAHAIVSEARARGLTPLILPRTARLPPRKTGVVHILEVVAASSKGARAAGPASEYKNDRAHIVGKLGLLTAQMTTYVPGTTRKSPNRYDAHAYCVTELAGLGHDAPGDPKGDVRNAAAASDELRRMIQAAASSRQI